MEKGTFKQYKMWCKEHNLDEKKPHNLKLFVVIFGSEKGKQKGAKQ